MSISAVPSRPRARRSSCRAAMPSRHTVIAVVRDVDPLGVETGAARAELREHATPVRVVAVERALHELAPGHRPRRGARLGRRPRAPDDQAARASSRPRRRPPSAGRGPHSGVERLAERPVVAAAAGRPARSPRRRWRARARCRWCSCSRRRRARRTSRAPRARARVRSALGSTAASVVSTASIVAIAGESIAAPLAIPPTVTPVPPATSMR